MPCNTILKYPVPSAMRWPLATACLIDWLIPGRKRRTADFSADEKNALFAGAARSVYKTPMQQNGR
jgi:hypothetical protein